jgi:hypothetical protein
MLAATVALDYDGKPAVVGGTYRGRQGRFVLVGWCEESGLPLVDSLAFTDSARRVPAYWLTGSRRAL